MVTAPWSAISVMGLPLDPPFRNVRYPLDPAGALKVPQRCTVVPGPICPELDPQLEELLNQDAAWASAQSAPVFPPVAF